MREGPAEEQASDLPGLCVAPTADLSERERTRLRALLDGAFGDDFSEHDWNHALGGVHVWVSDARGPISHGSLIARTLVCDGHRLRVGYVEAVATRADRRLQGNATRVMRGIAELIRASYPLGALSTGEQSFYSRLGWETWRGPTAVDAPDGRRPTPEDDGGIMILRTPASPRLDLGAEIVGDWRDGDVW
ncbi:MAG: GNAT family N-acetyltransferase [Myxococcota bacterium]